MAKKTQPRKDTKETRSRLRPLTQDDLQGVTGGNGVPGNYHSSSGGGGSNLG